MELRIWAKTLLSAYRTLPRLAEIVDECVEIRALGSGYRNLSGVMLCSTERVADDIVALINKKIGIINIRHMVDRVLENVPLKYARFLVLRYIDNLKLEEVAELLHVCERTIYRRQEVAIKRFVEELLKNGFTCERVEEIVNGQEWLWEMRQKFVEGEEAMHTKKIVDYVYINKAQKECKRFLI